MLFHRIALSFILIASLNCIFPQTSLGQNSPEELVANKTINQLYHRLNKLPKNNIPARINFISQKFLNKPYLLTALGEGQDDPFDQFPLYRTDAFDCETYVDTVLALALANNLPQFTRCINQVRYRNGKVAYINRNHFTCLDWNVNNQQQGFLKDITASFKNRNHHSVVKYAKAVINKPEWYKHKSISSIRLKHATQIEHAKRLETLKTLGAQLPIRTSTIAYIPFSALFDKKGNADTYLFKQIPEGSIIEIVRPNWDLTKAIGTHLNVSHLGFAIWRDNTLYFREASSMEQKVVEVSLVHYLQDAQRSPTIKGINIQIVLPHAQCS